MAKYLVIALCALLICSQIIAKSIDNERTPLDLIIRNVVDGVVNCPDGMLPGINMSSYEMNLFSTLRNRSF